jgi:hypothetical protein
MATLGARAPLALAGVAAFLLAGCERPAATGRSTGTAQKDGRAGDPPAAWRTVTTSDGVCQADLPGGPEASSGTTAAEGLGAVETKQLKLTRENGAVFYTLSHSDMVGELEGLSDREVLESVQETMLLNLRARGPAQLVRGAELPGLGAPGREVVVDTAKFRAQARFLLVKKRTYRVIAVTPTSEAHLAEAKRVLESFRLAKAK